MATPFRTTVASVTAQRGSRGESTRVAGADAMLLNAEPKTVRAEQSVSVRVAVADRQFNKWAPTHGPLRDGPRATPRPSVASGATTSYRCGSFGFVLRPRTALTHG